MNYVFSTKKVVKYAFPTHINELVLDRADSDFAEVFTVIIEPGNSPPLHKHDDTEQIFFIIEGKGILQTGNKDKVEYDIQPGDVVRIPVSTWHKIIANHGERIRYLTIDCFGSSPKKDEPTWDSHVKVMCREHGWDYDKVKISNNRNNN